MRVSDTKKKVGSVGVTAILLMGVGAGYAYWTSEGGGTGTVETGDTADITVTQTSTVSGLGPGVPAKALSGTFTNPGQTNVRVSTLSAKVTKVTKGAQVVQGCDHTDFEFAGFDIPVDTDVPAEGQIQWGTEGHATIAFKNKTDTNQDACKGATVEITYTVS